MARRAAVVARLVPRTLAAGSLTCPCVPSIGPTFQATLEETFAVIDRPLSEAHQANLSALLAESLRQGFAATPHAELTVHYKPEEGVPPGVHCDLEIAAPSSDELFAAWLAFLGGIPAPLEPDATLLRLVHELALPHKSRALELGPGARHALALARRAGTRVEVFEPMAQLAQALRQACKLRAVALRLEERNALDEGTQLGASRYDLVVLADLAPRLAASELSRALAKLRAALAPGGWLIFNAFLADSEAPLTELDLEHAQRHYSTFYNFQQLTDALRGAGLVLARDASVPSAEGTPRSYADWASGLHTSAAGQSLAKLRWFVATHR